MAAIIEAATDTAFPAPGRATPSGHVLLDQMQLADVQSNGLEVPDVSLWIIMNGPIVIPG